MVFDTSKEIEAIIVEVAFNCFDVSEQETIAIVHESLIVSRLSDAQKCRVLLLAYGDDIVDVMNELDFGALKGVIKRALSVLFYPSEVLSTQQMMIDCASDVGELGRDIVSGADDALETIIAPYVASNHIHGWG